MRNEPTEMLFALRLVTADGKKASNGDGNNGRETFVCFRCRVVVYHVLRTEQYAGLAPKSIPKTVLRNRVAAEPWTGN